MLDNYSEPEELLSDESFISWYFKVVPDQDHKWELWMAAHPGQRELVRQAIEILNTTLIPEPKVPEPQRQRAEAALMKKITALPENDSFDYRSAEYSGTQNIAPQNSGVQNLSIDNGYLSSHQDAPIRPIGLLSRYRWMAAASILTLLAVGLYITRPLFAGKPEVKTPYGQISQQQLPDGTSVTMNANSRLSYSPGWKDGSDREVWVNGEAFFHVTKTPLKSRFIVHTDHFDIIVTGTRFNVSNRHNKASVMLQEGSVIIHTPDGKELQMTPGDFVEFNSEQLIKRQVKNDSALAWKEQKLIFDKTPLRDIVTIIKDLYGIPVRLAADSIGDKTVCGILPNNNLDVLLQALEATADFEVVRENDSIIISGGKRR